MDFTPLYPHSSSSSSKISADGQYVVTAVGERLVVRSTSTMEVIRSWKCELKSEHLKSISTQAGKKPGLISHETKPTALSTRTNRLPSSTSREVSGGVPPLRPSNSLPASAENRHPLLTCVSFSANSENIVALLRQATNLVVFVYSLNSDEPIAQIKIGAEGVASGEKAVMWSPSGESLIIWSDWGLRVTVWSLTSSQSKPIQLHSPKHGPSIGSDFSPAGRYFALLCRLQGSSHDHVGVYDTVTWTCASFFELSSELLDPSHLSWSPCGRYIAISESALFDYRIEIWSPTGSRLGVYAPYHSHPDGPLLPEDFGHQNKAPHQLGDSSHSNSDKKDSSKLLDSFQQGKVEEVPDGYIGLGIRYIKWRCGGEYLAIGGWDGKVRILNDLSWTPVCEIDLNEYPNVKVLSEPRDWIQRTCGQGIIPFETSTFRNLPAPLRPDFEKPNPTIGVRDIQWSQDGEHLACRNDSMPHTIFVFSFQATPPSSAPSNESRVAATTPSIPLRSRMTSILHFIAPIKSMKWNPLSPSLAVVCATSALYLWHPVQPGLKELEGSEQDDYAEGVGIPARISFTPVAVTWTQGGSLLVTDKSAFCLAFPVSENSED